MTKLRNIAKKEVEAATTPDYDIVNTRQVVYSTEFGGFGLSREARNLFEEISGERFNSYTTPRHDPVLVHVVKELGCRANGAGAMLNIVTVKDKYIIREYDGAESVVEPEHIKWISVED